MGTNIHLNELKQIIQNCITENTLLQGVFSNPIHKNGPNKVQFKPVQTSKGLFYQITEFTADKTYHSNHPTSDFPDVATQRFQSFSRGVLFTINHDFHLLANKKGTLTILKKAPSKKKSIPLHNRQKEYPIPEGSPVDFLIHLGVMNTSGKVLPQKFDKFKQINRFLEIFSDTLSHFPTKKSIRIVDFGCGKSYLTFALYHYLKNSKGYDPYITGLDLKKDVIAFCSQVAQDLGYENLHFQIGDIAHFNPVGAVDLVVCLHACDTATDAALEQAVLWGTKVILAVPCCQHELFSQIHNATLSPLIRHGILKERFAALATDAARAQILEILGYQCQVMEFIDMEHTPKNLLIRAVRSTKKKDTQKLKEEYLSFAKSLQIKPSLQKLIEWVSRPSRSA